MYRNREFKYYIWVQVCMIALFTMISWRLDKNLLLVFVMGAVFLVINVIFTRIRYRDIGQLNEYLVQIQNKNFDLDVRDNQEGELSILKNEIYKLTKMLSSQSDLLQRDKRYLVDSISDISHQLKTPLTSMLMMVDLLEVGNLPKEKEVEFMNNIKSGLERMEWLIQSLLKLSKLDADAVLFKEDKMNVSLVIKKSLHGLLALISHKNILINLKESEELVIIDGDEAWIVEALTNIMKNCMEHMGEDGELSIDYSQNNLYTKIEIKDTGIGISSEDLPYVFERFYKGKNSKSDSVGIGLALSKQIINRQKGQIEVSSTEGIGTCFTIKFYS